MHDGKLAGIEPGLIKLEYGPNEEWQEFALVTTSALGQGIGLPNNVVAFYNDLQSLMKSGGSRIAQRTTAMTGYQCRDEFITGVEGRVVRLNAEYRAGENFQVPLVPGNNPYTRMLDAERDAVLLRNGMDVANSTWDDYKDWEKAKLVDFR